MIQGILINNRTDPVNNTFPFDETEKVENVLVRALRTYYTRELRSVEITDIRERDVESLFFRAVIICADDYVIHETGTACLTTYFFREYDTADLRLHVGLTVYLDESAADEKTQVFALPKPTKFLDLSQVGPAPTE